MYTNKSYCDSDCMITASISTIARARRVLRVRRSRTADVQRRGRTLHIWARAMVKARGGRVCPRGRPFFSSPTENGDAVDGGRVGFIPDSRWRGPCTSREDVLLGDVRIPLRTDTLFRVLQCDTQSERRGRRGQRGKRRAASTVIKARRVESREMAKSQVCKPKKYPPI